jgi:hypothetical protein
VKTTRTLHNAFQYLGTALLISSCANNPAGTGGNTTSTDLAAQAALEATLNNVRVTFDYQDYYSLVTPNLAGCAGDARHYYDAVAATSSNGAIIPALLQTNVANELETIRPSFIKNISVDITDSNSTVPSNLASACSYGTSAPTTNCATFDYGADLGVSSNLSGSIILVGGMTIGVAPPPFTVSADCSFSSNLCSSSMFALAVNAFPASDATDPPNPLIPGLTQASAPVSSWANLSSSTSYAGPTGVSGGSIAYDVGTQKLALFGGSTITPPINSSTVIQAEPTDTTWLFNTQTETWTSLLSVSNVNSSLLTITEQDVAGTLTLNKAPTARANFGYIALTGVSLDAMSTGGAVASGNIDTTDHIIISGGQDSAGYESDTHKFNPTYAPEWVDASAYSGSPPSNPVAGEVVQYLDNYEVQIMNNAYPSPSPSSAPYPDTQMEPYYPLTASPTPGPATDFGMAPVYNNSGSKLTGYPLVMGGFDPQAYASGTPYDDSCNGSTCAMLLGTRFNSTAGEAATSNFSFLGNLPYAAAGTSEFTPIQWRTYTGAAAAPATVPWYGGGNLLPGFSLMDNDVVFFGGSTCLNYLQTGESGCHFANPGVYYRLGTNPAGGSFDVPSGSATAITMAGTVPQEAGMAAARGQDASGNPIVVAYGGMIGLAAMSDTSLYVMYNNGGTPTWNKFTGPSSSPPVVANAAMVFSHATGKFYLFGGFSSTAGAYSSDTWVLSVSGSNCGTTGSCSFTWSQLDVANGLSCFPTTCPVGRRSHRMVEVNYSNTHPQTDYVVGSNCTPTSPCSFGIFMEGGTADGTSLLGDRWMFDPTSNNGMGAWIQMHEMPARALAAMTSVDYTDLRTSLPHHLAVLFGGETGMQNPDSALTPGGAVAPGAVVAPTLGDTWIYDYDTSIWNRVNILGQGYALPLPDPNAQTTLFRQSYNAAAPVPSGATSSLAELTPAPTSGGMMVTRTFANSATTGQIPEVYFLGGRTKAGTYKNLEQVYKFCISSTGESYASGALVPGSECDSYSPTLNPLSQSPLSIGANGYTGRWLRKTPSTGAGIYSYLGGAAYDSNDDLILVYGGLQGSGSGSVTDTPTTTTNVYEYTPPSSTAPEGSWAARSSCNGTSPPTDVPYAHTLSYDPRNKVLVSVGGNSAATGAPLQVTVNQDGSSSYTVPEIWTATRQTSTTQYANAPCYTWNEITTFGNNVSVPAQVPPSMGYAFGSGVYIPSNGYNSGYYSTFDSSCPGAGPISSPDAFQSGTLAGGAYIDIDRTQLGAYENVLLNLTFVPLDPSNTSASGTALTQNDTAIFDIHLVATGQSTDTLEGVLQPRFLTYTDNPSFPEVIQSLSILAPPTGQIRQEQVLIPLAVDPTIDRIRIERVSGTAILLDASIFRMGAGAGNPNLLPGINY